MVTPCGRKLEDSTWSQVRPDEAGARSSLSVWGEPLSRTVGRTTWVGTLEPDRGNGAVEEAIDNTEIMNVDFLHLAGLRICHRLLADKSNRVLR